MMNKIPEDVIEELTNLDVFTTNANDKFRFGNNMINQREKNLYSQSEVAKALNLSDRALRNWEKGENINSLILCCKLERVYGVSLYEIITGKKPN